MSTNYFSDNDDLRFYFERYLDWSTLYDVTTVKGDDTFASAEEAKAFYIEVVRMAGELTAREIGPRVSEIDTQGVHFEGGEVTLGRAMNEIFVQLRGADLHRLCLPRELDGANAPLVVYFANAEMLARADACVMTHHSFHGGMALAMLSFSMLEGTTEIERATGAIVKTRFEKEIAEIARGDAWGCMDITEPDAGSDMAALRTRGELGKDGVWRLYGQKIFITSGHGKYHFVVARTETATSDDDPKAGLGGLSMFLARTFEDGPEGRKRLATIERIEEKMGHHGSATAAITFDGTPGELIGNRGEGFKYMLSLMNNARVGVGFEGLGLCEAAYRAAATYAEDRHSMGKPIARHEMIADMLDEMRTDIVGIRALAMDAAVREELGRKGELAAKRGAPRFDEKTLAAFRARTRRATPLLKYLATEKAVEIARRAMQIHGGVGYMVEYGVEKLLRDAVVMPIYEGTSQIQSLMAMKDTLGAILKRPKEFATRLAAARVKSLSASDPLERRAAELAYLSLSAQRHLIVRMAFDKVRTVAELPVRGWRDAIARGWDPKRDFSLAMLHAERLTKILADEMIVEILLEQSKTHPERREWLERYLDRAELRVSALHREITRTRHVPTASGKERSGKIDATGAHARSSVS